MKTQLFSHQRRIIHCAHHKAGSYWVARVLIELANRYGVQMDTFDNGDFKMASYSGTILYDNTSGVIFDSSDYAGSHLIRDPRDVVVSGYFYHLWTSEQWVKNIPRGETMTYAESLKSLPKDQGMMYEMTHMGTKTAICMRDWNYNNPKFLELRYEDLITYPDETFISLFNHWGINPDLFEESLEVSRQFHMTAQTGRKIGEEDPKSHMRSGKPGQWMNHFTEEHKVYFKEKWGDLLIALGYEKSMDW